MDQILCYRLGYNDETQSYSLETSSLERKKHNHIDIHRTVLHDFKQKT